MNSVAERSPVFAGRENDWKLCRAFASGAKKAKEHIEKLPGHDDETYDAFKCRAHFLGATERTVEGLSGLLFRKQPQTNWQDGFAEYAADITRDGCSAVQLANEVSDEMLLVGTVGLLVDHPPQQEGLTKREVESLGNKPYVRMYKVENVLEVQQSQRGAESIITRVRLKELTRRQSPDDEFSEIEVEQVRVLFLDENNRYAVRIFEKRISEKGKKAEWIEIQEAFNPMRNGKFMDFIPFRLANRKGRTVVPTKPPLLDMVHANRAHLNDSALYQWGLMWTANPTPCFVNIMLEEGEMIGLGSSAGLRFGSDGKAFFLEFSGAGLGEISNSMESKRRDMATLGARMLMEDRKMVESAETAQIHRSGENSILASIAGSVSETMETVLGWVAEWAGIGGKIEFKVNKDFVASPLQPQQLTALMAAWQGGGITKETLFQTLQRGEIIAEGKTFEEYNDELEDEAPTLPAPGHFSDKDESVDE